MHWSVSIQLMLSELKIAAHFQLEKKNNKIVSPQNSSVTSESVNLATTFFFRDLLRPESGEEVAHLVSTYAGDENEHQRQMFDDSLRAALSLSEVRAMVSSLGFEAETVQATSDRHWTWIAIKP